MKQLFLTKMDSKVVGGIKVNIRNFVNTDCCLEFEKVSSVNKKQVTVCKVTGFFTVDKYSQKALKYLYNCEIPIDQYVSISVSMLNDRLSKVNLQEGDIYMFMAKDVALNTYQKKNGQTGYQLKVTAFDFDCVYSLPF